MKTVKYFTFLFFIHNLPAQVAVSWFNFPGGVAIATDAADNVYTANWDYNPAGDITLTKRNSFGEILWETGFDNIDNTRHEVATWVATDNDGNAIVSGTIRSGFSSPVNAASLLMKFDPEGNLLWRLVYENNFDGSSTRKCLVDADDNIYVLGLGNSGSGVVTTVKKFNPGGTVMWTYFDTAGIGAPINFKLTTDGAILIAARAIFGNMNGYAKISTNGDMIWSLPGINSLTVGDAAGDVMGNTYIVYGEAVGSTIKKLSPVSEVLWQQNQTMAAFRVEVGTDQSPVICGFPNSGLGGAAFMKYNENGSLLWSNPDADGPLILLLHAQLRLDDNNAAYLAASILSAMAVCKVNSDGSSAWTATIPTGTSQAIAFGSDNSIYVSGGTTARLTQSPDLCAVQGGEVSSTAPLTNLCLGDGFADPIQLSVTGNTGTGRFGLVRQNDLALVAQNATGSFNMENYPPGNYYAGHISVNQPAQLNGITNINQLTGCYDLSNYLVVNTQGLAGGVLSANGSTTLCDGTLNFSVAGNEGENSRFALLNSNLTTVLTQNTSGNFNLNPLPPGQYKVVHISYANGVGLSSIVPPNIPSCVAASNIISLIKVPCGLQLHSGPNPSSGLSWVSIESETDIYTTLEVYDMNGRQVAMLHTGLIPAKSVKRIDFNGNELPNGVYIYRLTTSETIIVEKFIMAK